MSVEGQQDLRRSALWRRLGILPPRVAPGRANLVVWALAIACALTQLAVAAPLGVTLYRIPVAGALILSLVQAAAIVLALFAPAWATVVALIAGNALAGLASAETGAPWPVAASTTVANTLVWIGVAQRARWWVPAGGWALSVLCAVMVAVESPVRSDDGAAIADLIVFAAVTLGAVLVGLGIRNWSLLRAQLRAERAATAVELARREAVEDKARIARELHDVVAHGMSAIQVRAASARYRIPGLDDEVAAEFDEVASTARSAMKEMRVILGLLRDEDADVEHAPQPGLADIPGLLARAGDLGPVAERGAWRLTEDERQDPILGLAAYRVVQEGLSNVARHAPGAAAEVVWTQAPGELGIDIRNGVPTRPAAPRADGGGHGLRGMRERLATMGGTVQTAAQEDGGFALHVRIPREGRG
ncbi:Putative two-component system sensor kinase [Microbacterium sp. 8M]|uniref:histidine kinase n=1 Tax=Microbacterium sp. 8M TaxID=2653153 RepID=UPI0012F34D28|nr:histidine kinase [Microbacterium sp. 8M]VXB82382.1 Putative two-component system sensor kinase [Microbacterium sp. 8M]